MQNVNETQLIEDAGFTIRLRPPQSTLQPRILLLLHGLSGNEDVMWVFARRLSKAYWVLSPRGLYSAQEGGYSWLPFTRRLETPIDEFIPSVERLLDMVDTIRLDPEPDRTQIDVLGFSQGAALTLSLAVTHPEQVRRTGCLSGFLPREGEKYLDHAKLANKPFFLAHGSKDDQVPVERARETFKLLKAAGARVTYCEDEVGHKLSLNCSKSMESFFSDPVLSAAD